MNRLPLQFVIFSSRLTFNANIIWHFLDYNLIPLWKNWDQFYWSVRFKLNFNDSENFWNVLIVNHEISPRDIIFIVIQTLHVLNVIHAFIFFIKRLDFIFIKFFVTYLRSLISFKWKLPRDPQIFPNFANSKILHQYQTSTSYIIHQFVHHQLWNSYPH